MRVQGRRSASGEEACAGSGVNDTPPTMDELTTARDIIERLFWSLPRTANAELVILDDALDVIDVRRFTMQVRGDA